MPESRPLVRLRREGVARLAAAGVMSPDHDTMRLLVWAFDAQPFLLPLVTEVGAAQVDRYERALRRRERREPLQHILGVADFYGLSLAVGVGVFTPRPETELLVEYVVDHLERVGLPDADVTDLCSGTGAIALGIQSRLPDARIVAVEADPLALEWADRNVTATGLPVMVFGGDVTDPEALVLVELRGLVDVVVSNPPYIPTGTAVDAETAGYDPGAALWGGEDGLDLIRRMLPQVAAIAKPGALVVMEHDATQGESLPALMRSFETGGRTAFTAVEDHLDLNDRPRFVTARRT